MQNSAGAAKDGLTTSARRAIRRSRPTATVWPIAGRHSTLRPSFCGAPRRMPAANCAVVETMCFGLSWLVPAPPTDGRWWSSSAFVTVRSAGSLSGECGAGGGRSTSRDGRRDRRPRALGTRVTVPGRGLMADVPLTGPHKSIRSNASRCAGCIWPAIGARVPSSIERAAVSSLRKDRYRSLFAERCPARP